MDGNICTVWCASAVRPEIFVEKKIHVMVIWLMILCSDLVVCQRFGGPCCLQSEDEASLAIQNVGTLLQHCTAS
jgi:hypothetical protein